MNKLKINYILDILLIIFFVIITFTSIVLLKVTSSGAKGIHKLPVTMLHNYTGIIFIILLIVHLILHIDWLKSATRNIFKK